MLKIKEKFIKVFFILNGIGFAVALCLKAGLGTDSIGLLCDGIHRYFQIGYGMTSLIYNAIVILIAIVFAKKNMGLGTIAYALTTGFFIDFYLFVLNKTSFSEWHILYRGIGFLFGHIMLALSLSLLIQLKLGMSALDALLYKLSEKTEISYKRLRTGIDIIYAGIGTLLGGVFGIGTIISILTMGYLISYFVEKQLFLKYS